MKIKRPISIDGPSFRYGIALAAEVACDYDSVHDHPYLVSDCILGKFNLLKRRPRKNRAAMERRKTLDLIMKEIEKTKRILARVEKRLAEKKKRKKGGGR